MDHFSAGSHVVDHERVRVFASPTLTASKAGFNTLTVTLLEDDNGI